MAGIYSRPISVSGLDPHQAFNGSVPLGPPRATAWAAMNDLGGNGWIDNGRLITLDAYRVCRLVSWKYRKARA